MKVLFITAEYPKDSLSNIYKDIALELISKKHNVKVVVPTEQKFNISTDVYIENNIEVLRVKTGNLYNINIIEKALSILTISSKLIAAIKKHFNNDKFDIILFMAPPVTMGSAVNWCMDKYNCPSYLMMKDIFPQNALDIGMLSKKNPLYWYFKFKEKKLYKTATKIGCMSKANINYLIKHNQYLKEDKLEIFPNAKKICPKEEFAKENKTRKKYNIPSDKVIAIYGGNMGKPQGIDFFMDIMKEYKNRKDIYFILLARGTEKEKVYQFIDDNKIKNILKLELIGEDEYKKILSLSDIGLIFLDKRFTIPNFPSKVLSYLEASMPVMAGIDINNDFKDMLEDSACGYWTKSGDIKKFKKKFDSLIKNKKLRQQMGQNGRKYLEQHFNVEDTITILERFMKERGN
jgi:glycosyltransferase involved in cell wall biosynthesis